MKPKTKFFEVGKYVRWISPDGYMMAGQILDSPGKNRQDQYVYPVELLNGNKTAVSADKLEIIPNQRKNMSATAKLALKNEIQNYNDMKKGSNPNHNGGIDQTALLKARESEISDLKAQLETANKNLEIDERKIEELLGQLEESPIKIEQLRSATKELKELVENLLSDDIGETIAPKAVLRGILPVVYQLITIC